MEGILNIAPHTKWTPEVRRRFESLRENAIEVRQIGRSLKSAFARFHEPDVPEKERNEYFRLEREWRLLGVQLRARQAKFQEALKPLIEAQQEADRKLRETMYLGVTRKAYEQIRDGMSSFDVKVLIGFDTTGEERSSAGSLKTVVWQVGYKRIVVTFRDNEVVAEAQYGL